MTYYPLIYLFFHELFLLFRRLWKIRLFPKIFCVFSRFFFFRSFWLSHSCLPFISALCFSCSANHFCETNFPQDLCYSYPYLFAFLCVRHKQDKAVFLCDAVAFFTDSLYFHVQFVAALYRHKTSFRSVKSAFSTVHFLFHLSKQLQSAQKVHENIKSAWIYKSNDKN